MLPMTASHDAASPARTSVSVKGLQPCWSVDRRVNLVGEPDAGNLPVRFDERGVETGHGEDRRAPADERAGNCYASPNLPRHLSTLLPIDVQVSTSRR